MKLTDTETRLLFDIEAELVTVNKSKDYFSKYQDFVNAIKRFEEEGIITGVVWNNNVCDLSKAALTPEGAGAVLGYTD